MVTVPHKLATLLSPQLTRRKHIILNTMIRGIGAVAMVWALAGCSGGMAMSGQAEPTLGAFGVGFSRGPIEAPLGRSFTSSTGATGVSPATDECGPGSTGD